MSKEIKHDSVITGQIQRKNYLGNLAGQEKSSKKRKKQNQCRDLYFQYRVIEWIYTHIWSNYDYGKNEFSSSDQPLDSNERR